MPHGRILITGGAGFVGSHLTEALLAHGHHVIALDDLSTGCLANLASAGRHSSFRFVRGSVLDEVLIRELVRSADAVVHLAAVVGVRLVVAQPLSTLITNIRGTEVVLEAARQRGTKVLVASTSEIYGKNGNAPLAETADRILGNPAVARWAYSTSKAVDEIMAIGYHASWQVPTIVVRPFNTVGPRQSTGYGMVVPRLVRQALRGEPLTVFGDGQQTRCFSHVTDVVGALVALLDSDAAVGGTYNIGSAEETTIAELAERVRMHTGSRSPVCMIPYDQAYGSGFEDVCRRVPDTSKLRALTGWRPVRTLDDILRDTVGYMRKHVSGPDAGADVPPATPLALPLTAARAGPAIASKTSSPPPGDDAIGTTPIGV